MRAKQCLLLKAQTNTHTNMCIPAQRHTLGNFTSKAAIIAIVDEQTNAAELDSPEPVKKTDKHCPFSF